MNDTVTEMFRVEVAPLLLLLLVSVASAQRTAALEAIGPVSVGKDGSLSRIANWDELTPQEKLAAQTALKRRNAKRLKKLREQENEPPRDAISRFVRWLRRRWRAVRFKPLDFAPEFVEAILTGSKKATTRWLHPNGGEPHLGSLRPGRHVRATCIRCADKGLRHDFALLNITRVETVSFHELSDELAAQEGLADGDDLRRTLLRFYPALQSTDSTMVTHFEVLGKGTTGAKAEAEAKGTAPPLELAGAAGGASGNRQEL